MDRGRINIKTIQSRMLNGDGTVSKCLLPLSGGVKNAGKPVPVRGMIPTGGHNGEKVSAKDQGVAALRGL